MEYRKLGNSGLKLSALSLGGWLTLGDKLSGGDAANLVAAAQDSGINFFDLADGYASGEAERQLGQLLKNRQRSQLVLSSKVFWPMSDDPNDRGLSRKHIFESVHRSLQNLQTDYLDIYFCHREDPDTPLEETVMAMSDLISQGKVLYWGGSMWSVKTLKKAITFAKRHGFHPPIAEQPPYNLLERWIEKKAAGYQKLGVGLVTWSPLAGGILTGKYTRGKPEGSRGSTTNWLNDQLTDDNNRKVLELCKFAAELDCKPAQLALAWLLQNKAISSVITGASSTSQLESNLGALTVIIPRDINQHLQRVFSH